MKYRIAILIAAATASACIGGNRHPIEIADSFDTRITFSGLKIFDYVAHSGQDPFPPVRFEHEQPMHPDDGVDDDSSTPERVDRDNDYRISLQKFRGLSYELLEKRLTETRFCRDGYLVLNSDISRMAARIRGECVEAASDEDRHNFPNNTASSGSPDLQ
tara:strand:- start:3728 stop:4207 length:480 start_codon:yes stop_codon:yes gene_type:complete